MLPCPGAFRAVGAATTCSLRRAPGRKKRQKEVGPSEALGSRRERDSRRPLARVRFHVTLGSIRSSGGQRNALRATGSTSLLNVIVS